MGAKKFGKATTANVGKQLAIILDGKIISAPSIKNQLLVDLDKLVVILLFKCNRFSFLLRSGALPAPMNIIEERTVGPDLGKDSIEAGFFH